MFHGYVNTIINAFFMEKRQIEQFNQLFIFKLSINLPNLYATYRKD